LLALLDLGYRLFDALLGLLNVRRRLQVLLLSQLRIAGGLLGISLYRGKTSEPDPFWGRAMLNTHIYLPKSWIIQTDPPE
jgi:hypothetical protein